MCIRDRAQALGVGEILVSGYRGGDCPWRVVPDVYPERGPLGGLHACFQAAAHPLCLVLSVDVPLVSAEILSRLVQAQRSQDSDTEQAYLAFICKRLKLNFRKLSVEERKWLKKDCGKIRLAEESKTAERTKIKNA